MPICFASCNVKDLWSTVIQRIFIWKPKYRSQMFMCMHDFFPIDCSYVKIDNKLQKKSPKLIGGKIFQQHFSVYWKVNVQQPLRTPYIILYQLLIHLIYGVIVMRKYFGIFFFFFTFEGLSIWFVYFNGQRVFTRSRLFSNEWLEWYVQDLNDF